MNKFCAVVPARRDSKGVVGKNLYPVGGIPLIEHTFRQLKLSTNVDNVIVTTDDLQVSELARNYGYVVVKRPEQLATDSATLDEVILDLMDSNHMNEYDSFGVFQPTSPLRIAEDIDSAIKLHELNNFKSVISATEIPYHLYEIFKYDNEKKAATWLSDQNAQRNRRQDYPEKSIYFMDGSIYIHCCQLYKVTKSLDGNMNFLIYLTPNERAIDIDNVSDIEKVEGYLKMINNKNTTEL